MDIKGKNYEIRKTAFRRFLVYERHQDAIKPKALFKTHKKASQWIKNKLEGSK